ncbi:hypothetical protein [Streptomyces sp. NPDC018055]|uniref:hypothetical protein n=1 Tax=Streptomyces sp. NPDC018055 TaxID=3365038 RepID=UPI00379FCF48
MSEPVQIDPTRRALAFNAVGDALGRGPWWLPLRVRHNVADAVLQAALEYPPFTLPGGAQEPASAPVTPPAPGSLRDALGDLRLVDRTPEEPLAETDATFDVLLAASSLGAPHVVAAVGEVPADARVKLNRIARSHMLSIEIAKILRKAAHYCAGDCGLLEDLCREQHPLQVGMMEGEKVMWVSGPVDDFAHEIAAALTAPGGFLGSEAGPETKRCERHPDAGTIGGMCAMCTQYGQPMPPESGLSPEELLRAAAARSGDTAMADLLRKIADAYEDHPSAAMGMVSTLAHSAMGVARQILSATGHRPPCTDGDRCGEPAHCPPTGGETEQAKWQAEWDSRPEGADVSDLISILPAATITAPWTDEQVDALTRYQDAEEMHPFTCGNLHSDGRSPVLDATSNGWRCPRPDCNYEQDWAYSFMAAPAAPKGAQS